MDSPLASRRARRGSGPAVLIALTGLLGMALGGAFQLVRDRLDEAATHRTQARLDVKSRETAQRIASLLNGAWLLDGPPAGLDAARGSGVWFERSSSLDGGEPSPLQLHRLAYELDEGELDDGLDNDGDGLADDGRVVLTRDPGTDHERRLVLCHGVLELVDGEPAGEVGEPGEPGFRVSTSGRMTTVALTLQCPDPAGGVLHSHARSLARTRLRR